MPEMFAAAVTAAFTFMGKLVDGQPPEVKRQMWEWFVKDMERLRKLLKIDD